MVVTNKKIVTDLIALEFVQKIKVTLKFPNENQEYQKILQRHFIRGYFDGDGSISIKNSYGPRKKWKNYIFC